MEGNNSRKRDKKKSKDGQKENHESKLEKLKNVVIRILKKHPEGILKSDIWSLVLKESGQIVSAKDYGLSKMGRAFAKWTDVIKTEGPLNAERLFFVDEEYFDHTDKDSEEMSLELTDESKYFKESLNNPSNELLEKTNKCLFEGSCSTETDRKDANIPFLDLTLHKEEMLLDEQLKKTDEISTPLMGQPQCSVMRNNSNESATKPQLNTQMHFNQMSGFQIPSQGHSGLPFHGINPQYAHMQRFNPPGVMIPTFGQFGMSFAGMPITYRIPMPGQVGGIGVPGVKPTSSNTDVKHQISQCEKKHKEQSNDARQSESPKPNTILSDDQLTGQSTSIGIASGHTDTESLSEFSSPVSRLDSVPELDQSKIVPKPAWKNHMQTQLSLPGRNVPQMVNFPNLLQPVYDRMPYSLQAPRPQHSLNQMSIPFPMPVLEKEESGRQPIEQAYSTQTGFTSKADNISANIRLNNKQDSHLEQKKITAQDQQEDHRHIHDSFENGQKTLEVFSFNKKLVDDIEVKQNPDDSEKRDDKVSKCLSTSNSTESSNNDTDDEMENISSVISGLLGKCRETSQDNLPIKPKGHVRPSWVHIAQTPKKNNELSKESYLPNETPSSVRDHLGMIPIENKEQRVPTFSKTDMTPQEHLVEQCKVSGPLTGPSQWSLSHYNDPLSQQQQQLHSQMLFRQMPIVQMTTLGHSVLPGYGMNTQLAHMPGQTKTELSQVRMPSTFPEVNVWNPANQTKMPFASSIQEQQETDRKQFDMVQNDVTKFQNSVGHNMIETKEKLTSYNTSHKTVASQFMFSLSDLKTWQPYAEDVRDFTVTPVEKEEFETKIIDVRPVFVPLGKKPSHDQVDNIAKECIETLADANEFVTPERVEQLLLQRFRCNAIYDLGFNHVDHIPCVKDLIRLVSKINAYITAFLKTRSICTLYELKEALRDYALDKGEFITLKAGPLQRFPVVYHQFRFPPDQANIPEITSMDILEHFNNYLTKNSLWINSKLELESFMNYLVQEYSAENAYMLGVRIRSLPLTIGVLKKAKRDSAACQRSIKDHFEENLKTDIEEAFRKFRMHILHSGDDTGLKVRTHYMKMKPELTIQEIFDKFNVLLAITQDRRLTKLPKFRRVIEDFLTMMKEDDLARNILHLAICMSNTDVEQAVTQMFFNSDHESDDITEGHVHCKPSPQKVALVESLKTYIERCLNAGALSLVHLNRIEEKLLEDFGFEDFSMMGYGRFLEFILLEETKQIIEESFGHIHVAGTGASDNETSFKPNQMDLMEFIAQCKKRKEVQHDHVEEVLLAHYGVKKVRDLGHGNIARLLNYAEKHGKQMVDKFSVHYESALVQNIGLSQYSNAKVGILGHQTKDAAKTCLHNCPLLENLSEWSHWSLVFEPEHGKLKQFVQKYGGLSTKTLEGGRIVTFDFLALETKPGELLKIVSSTSLDNVTSALKSRDVLTLTGHLVSMVVAYNGTDNMPLALIARHFYNELLLLHAQETRHTARDCISSETSVAVFVLQCILRIPPKICVSLANQIFLEPLGQVLGSSKSKQILKELCRTEKQLCQLVELGCSLGIQEWTDVILQKCQLSETAVQILPSEAEEFFKSDPCQDEVLDELCEEFDSDIEDVDEILAGDLVEHKERVMVEPKKKIDVEMLKEESDKIVKPEESTYITNEDVTKEVEKDEITSCEAIVNQIRRDEFGVGIQLSEDGKRLMKVQQERLGRSLDRLSKDLYSKDTHFVLELIQNADDNNYSSHLLADDSDECPSVKFVIEKEKISVLNNELGFREKDIKALCDVGRSTKGKHKFGYIGQKGIGFKSVFRVTDAPEVHSNGFHIKFDVNSGPMGYILPHWVPEEERLTQNEWMTEIILRLKLDMQLETRTLAARFNDIHPSLLLFLHRLRHISVENKVENSVQTMRRRDIGNNIVEIQHSHGIERWLVIKKMLDASKISLQTKSGIDVESTEIALAFPINKHGKKTSIQRMPPKQPIFAFLPLRSYGFRFIIQGDFDVPSSREDVDRDSSWNQWLRNEIHNVFVDCLDTFKAFPEFTTMDAVCGFLQFVPMEDEVLEFFKPVAADILKKLKAKQCIPTQPNNEGTVSWKMPSQTVRVRDPLVRSVVTPALLEEHLNLFYLHEDVASRLNSALTSCLGIETLTSDHLYQLGKAIIVEMGTHCSKDEDVVMISKWMACLYRSLDEFQQDDKILTLLKSQKMFPLSDGELVSLQDNTVFYPLKISDNKKHSGRDPLVYLQQDIKSIHPMLLKTGDDEVNSQVHKLLLRLGLKHLSPFDVINHHILPVLKTDIWKTKETGVLISYLIYIKEQIERQASVCNMDDIKEVAVVLTSDGFKTPSKQPVHFSPQYGNQINLKDVFSGYDWAIVDSCYIPQPCSQQIVLSWANFLRKLGVVDFLAFREKRIHIKRDELKQSHWKYNSEAWPKEIQEFIVRDFISAEVEGLIGNRAQVADHLYADQMQTLFTYIDHLWDNQFIKYSKAQVFDKDGNKLQETDSSFSILLRNSEWLPAIEIKTLKHEMGHIQREKNVVLKNSSGLYVKTEIVQSLLFDKVLYLNASTSHGTFSNFLGIKSSVDVTTVKDHLLIWSERKADDSPAEFCTTLEHMKNVYKYLYSMLSRQEIHLLFQEKPVLFVPDVSAIPGTGVVVAGKMLNRSETWLFDKTGLFDKHRHLLKEYHYDIHNKRTIGEFYNNNKETMEILTHEATLDMQPKLDEYIQLLSLLCETSSPKETNILHDVLYIFSIIGETLNAPNISVPGSQQAAVSANQAHQAFVKRKFRKQKVFPTNKQVWVNLADNPMVCDSKEFGKMFIDKPGVYFLDMEDKLHKTTQTTKRVSQRKSATGSAIQSEMIDIVIEVCGVKKLSECVDLRPTPEMILPCPKMQKYLSQVFPVLQQYMLSKHPDIYKDFEDSNIKSTLKEAKFYQTRSLEVSYWLPNMANDTFVIQQEKCFIDPPVFYFHQEHLSDFKEISREIARYFSKGDSDCNNILRYFLNELSDIINSVSEETVESLLQRYQADTIDIGDDDKWEVEAPELKQSTENIKEENESKEADGNNVSAEDGKEEKVFELRAWPPVANPSRTLHSTAPTERPASNIWPPPQGADYMKSVKELPSNIRLVCNDNDPNNTQEQRVEENKDNNTEVMSAEPNNVHGREQKDTFPIQFGLTNPNMDLSFQSNKVGVSSVSGEFKNENELGNLQRMHVNTEIKTYSESVQQADVTAIDRSTSEAQHKNHNNGQNQPVETEEQRQAKTEKELVEVYDGRKFARNNDQQFDSQGTSELHGGHRHKGFQNFERKLPFISGDPAWSNMATEYTYDNLGSGKDICVMESIKVTENDAAIGRWGEACVAFYLQRQKELGNIKDFSWKNNEEEQGYPFDFEIKIADGNGEFTNYIEVKSTASENKEVFEISVQQVRFASQMKDGFHIYRVFNAGNPDSVRLIRIRDLDKRLSAKQVKLFMLI